LWGLYKTNEERAKERLEYKQVSKTTVTMVTCRTSCRTL